VRLWHGIPGPPLLVICVKLKMMSKMSSMSIFTARPSCGFSSQEICVLILRDKGAGRICLFAPEQQQTPFFLTWTDCFLWAG
jgi:hypothetical protein